MGALRKTRKVIVFREAVYALNDEWARSVRVLRIT